MLHLNDLSFLAEKNISTFMKPDAQESLGSPYIQITLSNGRQKETLTEKAKNFIKAIMDVFTSGKTMPLKSLK